METLGNQSDSTAAGGPRWVLLNPYGEHDCDSSANAKTTAASCTSSAQPFTVAAPPACSRIHGGWVGCAAGNGGTSSSNVNSTDTEDVELQIIASHDDAVLIEIMVPGFYPYVFDHFLYDTGAGRRPPSLSLLPGCYHSMQFQRDQGARRVPTRTTRPRTHGAGENDVGILRCGDGEVLVAQLEVDYYKVPYTAAELCVLRPGAWDWVLRRVPIVHHAGEGEVMRQWTEVDAVVPVGTRFMCWVDYLSGILVCNMAAEEDDDNTKLRYVPLPPETRGDEVDYDRDRPQMQCCRSLAAAGPGAVRLVSVAPRCGCGGQGRTTWQRSRSAFNVTTWTLALRTDEPMAWVKDGVLDCDELWQLPNYGRLPHVELRYPYVTYDDADVVCFIVCGGDTEWMVEINTRTKALLSVIHSENTYDFEELVPAKLCWK